MICIKKLFLIIGVLFICGCAANKESFSFERRMKVIQQEFTPSSEMFNKSEYEKFVAAIGTKMLFVSSVSASKQPVVVEGDRFDLSIYDDKRNLLREYKLTQPFIWVYDYIDKYTVFSRQYNSNGSIIEKGIGSFFGFGIGNRYFFTPNGKLDSITNDEDCYNFDFKKVFRFCTKHNIKQSINITSTVLSIKKIHLKPDNRCVWEIENSIYSSGVRMRYILDGATGKIINYSTSPIVFSQEDL